MTIQCCKCKSVKTGEHWDDAREMLTDTVSHTYCPSCFAQAMDEIRTELVEQRTRSRRWMKEHLAAVSVQ